MFIPLFKVPPCCNSGVSIERDRFNHPRATCQCEKTKATTYTDNVLIDDKFTNYELARLCEEWNTNF